MLGFAAGLPGLSAALPAWALGSKEFWQAKSSRE
jgi:hypothetical protein